MGLTAEQNQTLLAVSDRTERRYRDERHDADLERDTLERISHILNLWLDLRSIFRTEDDARRWLTAPNRSFGDQSPLQRMLGGNVSDLIDVRYHVQSALVA